MKYSEKDAKGRIIKEWDAETDSPVDFNDIIYTAYYYDDIDRRIRKEEYSFGELDYTTTYDEYNSQNLCTKKTKFNADKKVEEIYVMEYDGNNNMTKEVITYPQQDSDETEEVTVNYYEYNPEGKVIHKITKVEDDVNYEDITYTYANGKLTEAVTTAFYPNDMNTEEYTVICKQKYNGNEDVELLEFKGNFPVASHNPASRQKMIAPLEYNLHARYYTGEIFRRIICTIIAVIIFLVLSFYFKISVNIYCAAGALAVAACLAFAGSYNVFKDFSNWYSNAGSTVILNLPEQTITLPAAELDTDCNFISIPVLRDLNNSTSKVIIHFNAITGWGYQSNSKVSMDIGHFSALIEMNKEMQNVLKNYFPDNNG